MDPIADAIDLVTYLLPQRDKLTKRTRIDLANALFYLSCMARREADDMARDHPYLPAFKLERYRDAHQRDLWRYTPGTPDGGS